MALKRPFGVSVMSVLYFVSVGSYAVLLFLAIAAPGTLRSLFSALSPQGSGPAATLAKLGSILPIYFFVMAAIVALLGYGMWTLRNWARLITSMVVAVSLIFVVISLVPILGHLNLSTLLLSLLRIALCLLVLWYLWTPSVRAAFCSHRIPKEVNP